MILKININLIKDKYRIESQGNINKFYHIKIIDKQLHYNEKHFSYFFKNNKYPYFSCKKYKNEELRLNKRHYKNTKYKSPSGAIYLLFI